MKKGILCIFLFTVLLIYTQSINAQWQQVEDSSYVINCLAISGSNIFAGTDYNGMLLSNDNGNNWAPANNGLSNNEHIGLLAINGSNIFAGGGSMFLSTNNGGNWARDTNGFGGTFNGLFSIATNGSYIFAGTFGGIYLSTNNGGNWNKINNGLPVGSYSDIRSLVVSGSNIFAGTGGWGVFLSKDSGSSWTAVNNGLPTQFYATTSFSTSGPNIFTGTDRYGVFLSTNDGNSWTAMNNGLNNLSINSLMISDANIFAGTDEGVYLSTNGANNWTKVNDGFPWQNMTVNSLVVNGTDIFAGTGDYNAPGNRYGVWKRSLSNILALENKSATKNDFIISPNPATTQLTIHTSSFYNEATVSIMNVLGQMTSSPAPLLKERGDAVIDVSKLPAGIYFVQVVSDKERWAGRFVKE